MAVEAPHINLFSSPGTRVLFKTNQVNADMDSGIVFNGTMLSPPVLPFYQSPDFNPFSDFTPKDDSGLTYNNNHNNNTDPPPLPQSPTKRRRDSIQKSQFSFLDPDFNPHIHLYQSEIDSFVADYTQKVRTELEERRNKQSRILISSIQQGIVKKLKEKDDEMQRIRKLNWFLQERVKSLCIENQIWRDLAQSNEATANSLRNNLEQVLLAQVSEERQESGGGGGGEDAESRCGGGDNEEVEEEEGKRNKCKKCGEREESVVLIPCRHLCLCTVCGSSLFGTCPLCDSPITGMLTTEGDGRGIPGCQ
ncbi:BOI-related E3 ubiquitin-protein ligase 1 [Euphorbia lathyris]|uniref:BOI-related E3 ubiquitin-protein ligase 1 n=1 Tax=Euphorbia lathyris TaxID=212925 RepID=UPI0033135CFE